MDPPSALHAIRDDRKPEAHAGDSDFTIQARVRSEEAIENGRLVGFGRDCRLGLPILNTRHSSE